MICGIQAQFLRDSLMPKYAQNKYNWTLRSPWHKSKASFDVKSGAKDFGLFCVSLHMIWDIGVQFPWIASIPE